MKKEIAFLILIILECILLSSCGKNLTVFTVNDNKVSKEEFDLILEDKRSETFFYFSQKYNVEDSNDFWVKDFDGITPIQYAKELALEQLKEIKCKQELMIEYGVISDASYSHFLKKLKQENADRLKKDIVYGQKQYGVKEYYIYLLSNNESKLKDKMNMPISEEELILHYNENKEIDYKYPDYFKLLVDDKEIVFEPLSDKSNSQAYPEVYQISRTMKQGQIEQVIIGEDTVTVKCLIRREGEYMSFDEVKDHIRKKIIDRRFNEIIQENMAQADIVINQKVYSSIK